MVLLPTASCPPLDLSSLLRLVLLLLLNLSHLAEASTIKIGALINDPTRDEYGARIAVQQYNDNPAHQHTLQLVVVPDGGSKWSAMRAACTLLRQGVHAIVGPSWSSTSGHVLEVTTAAKVPVISYSATSSVLGDSVSHPYFARTIGSDLMQAPAMIGTVRHFNWTHVCILAQDDNYGLSGSTLTAQEADRRGIKVMSSQSYDASSQNAQAAVQALKTAGCRVIIHWCLNCATVMNQANDAGLLKGGDFVWLLSDGCDKAVNNAGYWGKAEAAMVGSFCLLPAAPPGPGKTAFLQRWSDAGRTNNPSIFSLFMHDAVLLAAHAVVEAASETVNVLTSPFALAAGESCILDSDDTTARVPWPYGEMVSSAMAQVSFVGATSGINLVQLTSELERTSTMFALQNFQSDVGTLNNNDGVYRIIANIDVGTNGATGTSTAANKDVFVTALAPIMWSAMEGFRAQIPSDTMPRTLQIKTYVSAPFVTINLNNPICTTECAEVTLDCPDECYQGLTFDVFRYLMGSYFPAGVKYNIQHYPACCHGYNDMLKIALVEDNIDMVVGDSTATSEREAFVSLSYPYFDTGLILARRVENNQEGVYTQNISEALLRVWTPFKQEVWFVIMFVYLPLMALAFYWFERESNPVFTSSPNASFLTPLGRHFGGVTQQRHDEKKKPRKKRDRVQSRRLSVRASFQATTDFVVKTEEVMLHLLWAPIYYALAGFAKSPVQMKVVTMPGQLLTTVFYFCNILIIATYTANLAASLTLESSTTVGISGVNSIGSVIPYDNILLGTVGGSVSAFWKSKFPGVDCYNCADYGKGWSTDSALDFIKNASNSGKAGTGPLYVISEAHAVMHRSQTDCGIETVGSMFYEQGYSMFLRQNTPVLSQVSAGILAMRESIKMGSLISQYFGEAASNCVSDSTELLGVTRMSMKHMGGIFFLALFGVSISSCFFVCCRKAEKNDRQRTQNENKKTKKVVVVLGNGEVEEQKDSAVVELTAVPVSTGQKRVSSDASASDAVLAERAVDRGNSKYAYGEIVKRTTDSKTELVFHKVE